jgi:thiol-disulfide isomerase/thioredoxin
MIDKHHLRHYVKVMARPRNSGRWLLVLAAFLALGFVSSGAWAGSVVAANAGKDGETLEVKSLPVKGKTTLIDFYSPFCPPCMRLAPVMKKLAARRSDLAIKKVNINRPGIQGIDWQSPLAQQYGIRQVPYFMIFSPTGKLAAKGRDAEDQVIRWLQEEDLMKR